jgi:hnRNP-L/PTB/hephaestus splicing factor
MFQGCCHLRVSFSKRQHLIVKVNDHKSRDFTVPNPLNPLMGLAAMYGAPPALPPPQMAPMRPLGVIGGEGCVLIVNKLHEEQTTPQVLFTLFGVYGDVLRVKILFNKRDTALVEFATEAQARIAKQNLNRCPLFGQLIQVNMSKHSQIQMPREEDGKELTKDFTTSDAHRFKHRQFISQKNVNPPSQVLHVANIHESVQAEDLIKLFAAYQPQAPRPPLFEFFKTNRSMAYVGMNSIDEAVRALVALHNYKLTYPLRVSFSHKDIRTMS